MSNERFRSELYVGIFHNQSWTIQTLCDYFHQLIEGSYIIDCRFYPCTHTKRQDHSFAILTFDSISSIDQCLAKRDQIKKEHGFLVKRDLKDTGKDQRAPTEYIQIHINQYDESFVTKNIFSYFGQYGSIIEWKILDNGQTYLLKFKDYDSVDRIILDKPHYFNEQCLAIRKCYQPNDIISGYSKQNILKEKIRNLKAGIERTTYLHEAELKKLEKELGEEISREENRRLDIMKSYIRFERIQRDLKQDLMDIRQINQKLKMQLHETIDKKKRIIEDFQNQIQQQQLMNESLQESIKNLPQMS